MIDAVDTEELDEPVQSETDTAWVHVHIADPTSVLPPTHVFAPQAREQIKSAHFSHRTWPLLPEPFMRNMLSSVGSTAASGQPEPVFQLQSRQHWSYKVRADIVRKVIRTTYEAVDRALGLSPVFLDIHSVEGHIYTLNSLDWMSTNWPISMLWHTP